MEKEKLERLSLIFDGFFSGFLCGILITAMAIAGYLKLPMQMDVVITLLLLAIACVALLAYAIHRALKTE